MVGNIVYVVLEHMIREDVRQIRSVHATWDGAYRRMCVLADINQAAGYNIQLDSDGSLKVYYPGKGLVYEYSVSTRTIEE